MNGAYVLGNGLYAPWGATSDRITAAQASESWPTFYAGAADRTKARMDVHELATFAVPQWAVGLLVETPPAAGAPPAILARRSLHEDGAGAGNRRTWTG